MLRILPAVSAACDFGASLFNLAAWASGLGTFTSGRCSVVVQIFTFILTDLIDFEATPIKIELESEEEAGTYGAKVAREILEQMPDLGSRGMCVLIRDDSEKTVSIVPLDPVS
jgi:hypothetical protein